MAAAPPFMRLLSGPVRAAALALSLCAPCWAAPLAIVHVTVVDGDVPPRSDQAVVVDGDRLVEVGVTAATPLPPGTRVVDGRGRYLIPGLWDMHVHVLRPPRADVYFPLLIAMGITGVRDMGGDAPFAILGQWQAGIAAGTRVGPRFVAPGPFVDGPYPSIPQWSRVVRDADEARTAVRELKRDGADFIKVYNRLPREAYFALADEARRQGIPFAGHVPGAVTAREAAVAGQRSIEHLFNVLLSCSPREAELMQRKAAVLAGGEAESRRQQRRAYLRDVLAGTTDCGPLFETFARLRTWQVPTLVQRRAFAEPESVKLDEAAMAYVPASQRVRWLPGQDGRIQGRDEEDRRIERQFYERDRALVAPMFRAGVPILAGTDAGDPYALPGYALHDELAALVEAGLPPQAALRSATRGAAEYLGLE
ncbi:MAG: amidohydrolase family protein, partial [Myxococcota bacterium]